MRALLEKCAALCADRLTVQERWLLLAFLGLVVLGSFVKYARARPQTGPGSTPVPMSSSMLFTDDQP